MALPSTITSTTPVGTNLPSTLDDQIRALKLAIEDIFGIPDATAIAAAGCEYVAAGLKNIRFQDAAANPATAGYLQRNGANLLFYDGTAARTLVSTAATQTLTNKTLTTPTIASVTGAMAWVKGADLASAATVDLSTATGNYIHITGTTTITSFGAASTAGDVRLVEFDGSLTVTHGSPILMPYGANYITQAGDKLTFVSTSSGVWACFGISPYNATSLAVGGRPAKRATTSAINGIDVFDGTAPVGTLANGITLYSTAGELRVMDAGGTATLLSPHDEQNKWVFSSKRADGTVLHIQVEDLLKALNTQLGGGFIEEYVLTKDMPFDPTRKGDVHWNLDKKSK